MIRTNVLIDALLEPERYPHPVTTVTLRQTHLSWVLLAGEFAYKIKKPVRLDFVDFSSLERRKHYCEEELRLNRRFAPALYLDVVPIRGSAGQPTFEGDTPPQEYAVRLHRFAADQELGSLLERDAITAEELNAFGCRLAQLHAACPPHAMPGAAARSLGVVRANLGQLQATMSAPADTDSDPDADTGAATGAQADVLASLSSWLSRQGRVCAPQVEQRGLAGWIRECHGDLHAGNIVRFAGTLTAFDCLEFDVALRRIDVLDDAAFLVMDLLARKHRGLAYAFLNGWLEVGGDYAAAGMLRFFMVHRALVRAKVQWLGGAREESKRYLHTALSLTQAAAPPALILTCGLSGSGKTWLSDRLVAQVGAIRIRSDVERKRLAGLRAGQASGSPPGEGIYSPEFNARVYAHLLDRSAALLAAGENVIVDAAFLKQAERRKFMNLARDAAAPVAILHCVGTLQELSKRLLHRQRSGHDASEADAAVMRRQVDSWESLTEHERSVAIEVDTADAQAVLRAIAATRRLFALEHSSATSGTDMAGTAASTPAPAAPPPVRR